MTNSLEERIAELEARLMHQEQAADDLTGILVRQDREIKMLEARLLRLQDRMLAEMDRSGEEKDPRPPHY